MPRNKMAACRRCSARAKVRLTVRHRGKFVQPVARSPGTYGDQNGDRAALTAFKPTTIDDWAPRDVIGWPPVSEADAMLQILSLVEVTCLGVAAAQWVEKKPALEDFPGTLEPTRRVKESREAGFPLEEEARHPQDVVEAAPLFSGTSRSPRSFPVANSSKPKGYKFGNVKWRASLSNSGVMVQGELRLPLLARILNGLGVGRRNGY